jgi:penicillin-binding protein 1B
LIWRQKGTPDWKPQNYDKKFHDKVQLRTALAHSYNVSAARLGIDLGIDTILDKLTRFGVERRPPPFASSLLGAFELSPMEVAQLYQTFADGGFRTPLRAIREIVTAQGKPLQRYPLVVEQVAEAGPVYLLTAAMQGVVREGTGQGLSQWLPAEVNAAGKTGTTDDLRDSWFAGYTGDQVAVVWVGRDDNKSTGLTGASGAMTIWGETMRNLQPESLQPPIPDSIEILNVDPVTGMRTQDDCKNAVLLPFIKGSMTGEMIACSSSFTSVQNNNKTADVKASETKLEVKQDVKPAEEKKSWFRSLFN